MAKKAKKSQKKQHKKATTPKITKPTTQPTPEPTVTKALTVAPQPAIPTALQFTIQRRQPDQISVQFAGKQIGTVPIPADGQPRAEVVLITKLLTHRLSEVYCDMKTAADLPVANTKKQAVIEALCAVGIAYL